MPISTPPLDYKLDREGTSGISTGPELTILDWSDDMVPCGTVGRICVRSEPIFPGYLKPDGTFDKSPFSKDGWFDSGDLGYMDEDGYLYITGRSKEVINRGGELISPFEVENAIMSASKAPESPLYGRVSQALAFSATHDVLQEVVAIALVTPPDVQRADLKAVHLALRSSLQQVKWPVLITYMQDLPKNNNKVLRIKLGQRLSLPDVTDDTPYLERHWEAVCPPADTPLSASIKSSLCAIDFETVSSNLKLAIPVAFKTHCRVGQDGSVEAFIAPVQAGSELCPPSVDNIKLKMSARVHNYMVPSQIHVMPSPLPQTALGIVDEHELEQELAVLSAASMKQLEGSTEGKITKAFAEILACSPSDIPRDVDFFALGGDSLRAGRLLSALRGVFNISLPIGLVFNDGTVKGIAEFVEQALETLPEGGVADNVAGCTKTHSSTNPLLMLVQLIPLAVIYPLRRAFQWTAFLVCLAYSQELGTHDSIPGRLLNLVVSLAIASVVFEAVAPFFGIAAKWIIIGRHREGLYPMWGLYHTRWWLTQKIVAVAGKGYFETNDFTERLYLRLMGAKVGKNVKLSEVTTGEWDLLDIRDNAALTLCTVRPFAVEGNSSMYLGRIVVGENCIVGVASTLAPGSELPPNTCIGVNSSSWEQEDADEANRHLSPTMAAKPHWALTLFLNLPISFACWFISIVPWLLGLLPMVFKYPQNTTYPLQRIMAWFTSDRRVAIHYLALVFRVFFGPLFVLAFTIIVKKTLDLLFGKLKTGPNEGRSAIAIWRASLIKTLMTARRFQAVANMFGAHYEATSVTLRMLGAQVGKRVYWPGTGPIMGDYHLLNIGNDVVFGSRAHLITSDGHGSEMITVKDRAMIADRVALLPGVEVSERTTMGSGAVTRRGKKYGAGGTYVGSKGGDAICLSTGIDVKEKRISRAPRRRMQRMSSDDTFSCEAQEKEMAPQHNISYNSSEEKETAPQRNLNYKSSEDTLAGSRDGTSKPKDPLTTEGFMTLESDSDENESDDTSNMSPFGRAFYLKQAPYHVLGPFAIFLYSAFVTIFTAFYWNVASISSIQLVNFIMKHFSLFKNSTWRDVPIVFLFTFGFIAVLTTIQAIVALLIVIAAKWALLGRRQPGNYDWDKFSYCQRWQIFLSIEKLRRQCFQGDGVLGMLTGTSWIVMYFRALGADIGKDCALFANGKPSLMFTEPDLVKLGDRVVVDDASVVGHINTRGRFDLNRLEIGDRCVLRSGSRLLSGANMKDESCLLEHTLIMGGDIVEERWTMQGWPAERYMGKRVSL